jgi:biotin carboxyl carrier protein
MAKFEIKSEIAGTVLSIEVKVGDAVAEDAEIALVEAMKMEIPVTATKAGIITSIVVQVGAVIAEGDVVAIAEIS